MKILDIIKIILLFINFRKKFNLCKKIKDKKSTKLAIEKWNR